MPAIPPDDVRSLLRGLPRERFVGFAAALWEARGWEVRREGDRLRVRDLETGREEVLLAVPARLGDRMVPRRVPEDEAVTAVLVAGSRPPSWARERADVAVVDATELREMALYAVDDAERRALFREFFGREPVEPARPSLAERLRADLAGRVPTGRLDGDRGAVARRSVQAAVVLAAAAVVVVAIVGAGSMGWLLDGGAGTATPSGTPEPTATPQIGRAAPPAPYPPGVNESGVVDANSLIVSHIDNVSFNTYTVAFTYREVGPNHTALATEVIHRVADTRYVTNVTRVGHFRTVPWVVSTVEAYANGRTRFERLPAENGSRYQTQQVYSGRVGLVERRGAAVIEALLADAADVSVTQLPARDGLTFYRLRVRDDGDPTTANDSAVLLVDERGVVHTLQWTYERRGVGGLEVSVSMRYSDFGETTMTDPPWLDAANNATSGDGQLVDGRAASGRGEAQ